MTAGLVDRDQAFLASIRRIADEVAAPNADGVDRDARFPSETIDALRAEGALAALVPAEMDGGGMRLETIAAAVFELGRRCGASGMVFGMHQIQVATLIRHADDAPWFQAYLRELAREQRLIASVTSEVGTGGDIGRSIAAVTPAEDGCATFEKAAPTVSYGSYADDFLTTLRRTPDAEPGDQVLALTRRDQTTLEQNGTWDPLGMRGTCSPGFIVRAEFPTDQIMPTPFSTHRPGVDGAGDARPVVASLARHRHRRVRPRARVRPCLREGSARGRPAAGTAPVAPDDGPGACFAPRSGSGLRDFTDASETDRERLTTMATILRFNNLKLAASEHAPKICQGALGVTGIVGFKNDTPFSVGRHIRDSMSASLMVANERIHQTNASLLLIAKDV